jgi:hypothetical protein
VGLGFGCEGLKTTSTVSLIPSVASKAAFLVMLASHSISYMDKVDLRFAISHVEDEDANVTGVALVLALLVFNGNNDCAAAEVVEGRDVLSVIRGTGTEVAAAGFEFLLLEACTVNFLDVAVIHCFFRLSCFSLHFLLFPTASVLSLHQCHHC